MFQVTGFQANAFQIGGVAAEPVAPVERSKVVPAGKSTRRRKLQVEIDGQVFDVASQEDAEYLLLEAKAIAEQQAHAQAQEVIKKRKTAARREKKPLKLEPVTLTAPRVVSRSDEADALAAKVRQQLKEIYEEAARDAEIALHMHYKSLIDEDEAIVLLLMSE